MVVVDRICVWIEGSLQMHAKFERGPRIMGLRLSTSYFTLTISPNNQILENSIRVSYCMVCVYVREGNPRALARGLSPVHTHNRTITALLHQHACALCAL